MIQDLNFWQRGTWPRCKTCEKLPIIADTHVFAKDFCKQRHLFFDSQSDFNCLAGSYKAWYQKNVLFRLVIKMLTDHKVEFFCNFGTLITIVRNKYFMPWDDDLDLAINMKDFNSKITPNTLCAYGLKRWHPGRIPKLALVGWKRRSFMDLFGYDITEEGLVKMPSRLFSFVRKRPGVVMSRGEWSYPKELIFPLQYANFYEMSVPIPRNYKLILEKDYGPDVMNVCRVRAGHAGHYKRHFKKLLDNGYSWDCFDIPMNHLKIKLQPFSSE